MIELPFPNESYLLAKLKDGDLATLSTVKLHSIGGRTKLEKFNAEGCGLYFTPATFKPSVKTARKTGVVHVRAVWVDKDNGPLPTGFTPAPSITVNTSPGRYQYYWMLDKPATDQAQVEDLLSRLIQATEADSSRSNWNSLMRLPGSLHQKHGTEVTIEHRDLDLVYSIEYLQEQFPAVSTPTTDKGKAPSFNYRECIDNILTGEVIHEARTKLSMHWANVGVSEHDCLEMIDALLDTGYRLGNIETKRYNERKANNKQVVGTAYTKINSELDTYDVFEKDSKYTKLPALPSHFGLHTLVQDIMGNMFHPVYEIAVPLAMHLVGTFGTGTHHLGGVTGSKRRAICMASGSGKDIVSDYIHACIDSLDDARAHKFIGAQSFTPRTVHAELMEFRCRSYIVSEAGLRGQSEAGDVKNFRAYQLQALGAKWSRTLSITQTTADFKASKEAGQSLQVVGAVVNIIAESTAETYAKMLAFSDADVTGMMAREELIFPEPDFSYEKSNADGFVGVGESALEILRPLAQNFLDNPLVGGVGVADKMFTAVDTEHIRDELKQYHKWHCEQREKHKTSSQAVSTQYSRMFEKIKCTALVLALADGLPVRVTAEHLEYARNYHMAILKAVISQMDGGALGSPMEASVLMIEKAVTTWPDLARDKKFTLNEPKRIVSKSWMSNVLDPTKGAFKELVSTVYRGKSNEARRAVVQEAISKGLIDHTKYEKKDAYKIPKVRTT